MYELVFLNEHNKKIIITNIMIESTSQSNKLSSKISFNRKKISARESNTDHVMWLYAFVALLYSVSRLNFSLFSLRLEPRRDEIDYCCGVPHRIAIENWMQLFVRFVHTPLKKG